MKRILLLINQPVPPFSEFAAMFSGLLEPSGQFKLEVSHDRSRLQDLSGFDGVALYIAGGELTRDQEQGLTGFVRHGGGLLAVHASNASLAQYEDYMEMVGSEFVGHDPLAQFDVETAPEIDDILPRLSRTFRMNDECYNLKIRTSAPLRFFQHATWRMDRKPLGYVRDYGEGRVFYTALGHDRRAFGHPDFQDQLIKGLRYVCNLKDRDGIRIGLVGYGPAFGMGKHHSEQIAKTAGFTLAAVCDKDPARLEAAKQEQGAHIATFTDAAELIRSELIDLAVVIVPHAYHAPVAKPFLQAGIHVITEKPFVVHVSDADDLIATAREKGVMLSVYHNRHWDPEILSLRQIVESGVIGEPYSIECNMVGYGYPGQAWRTHKPISGGLLYDMGAHQFEKILQLVPRKDSRGNRINKRASLYGNFLKRVWHSVTNEDFGRAYVRFDSGLEAQLLQSNIHAASRPLWMVQGTRGSAVMESWDGAATVTVPGEDGRLTASQVPAWPVKDRWVGYYKNVADHLLAGLPLIITPEWAKGTIQCIEGCEIAARENRIVEIEFAY